MQSLVTLGLRSFPILATSLIVILSTSIILETGCPDAMACQCDDPRPEIYEEADVIFVGTITKIDAYAPLENTRYITFDVSKSWKAVDTKSITIHNDSGQCDSMVAIMGYEYLIYAKNEDILKINVACGGSIWTGYGGSSNEEHVARDIMQLDALYEPVELTQGHTVSVNIFPPLQILGTLVALGIVAFLIIRRR